MIGWSLTILALFLMAGLAYLGWYLRWEARQTTGMAYYGRTLAGRRALKRRIRLYSRPAIPVIRALALLNRQGTMPSFEYGGVCGPPKASSPAVFERASQYQPRSEDVFVVTQMRCGTTWMQQIVYETVTRGRSSSGASEPPALYAVSPWIDGINSVSIEDAPLIGRDRPTRIIKSHLPTALCPYSPVAKYIYVTRHPVSCFASIVDYNRSLLGPLMPAVPTLADWFCSDRMYWLPWPRHVEGWWQWAEHRNNVLFVHFEEMLSNFSGVLDRVEAFVDARLTEDERRSIEERCSFQYMKAREELFEMAPPTMFSVNGGEFLARGTAARHQDVTPAIRERILSYCREALSRSAYPAGRFYADLEISSAGVGPAQR